MDVYHYSEANGVFLSKGQAQRNPVAPDNPLIQNNATPIAPPDAGENEVAVFKNGAWLIKPDFRGVVYWLPDGSLHEISEIDEVKPKGALDEAPKQPEQDPRITLIAAIKDECLRLRKIAAGLDENATTADLDYKVIRILKETLDLERIALSRQLLFSEQQRLDELTALDRKLETILVRSNALQAMHPTPDDWMNKRWWQ